ncbi:CDP-diacylglycerol-glycerol-3-phosphate 3-phosphatidyltransferase-like [Carpediemonas membranifera]|uniref:CDP-diacylglycerol-glycerol-3-phosphate 3-phosphatidyltransferase-like n=1 Tax=Carpediemonas membranifera TaxID=201153 RepID=A0A8J6E6H0_9EUKA|nr:CDP-diacylglycerol-glycerol-3-phosphate 3-phosphatidyltransferase-like [Carpediemonas membranifera]|eukprot:KAG9397102.1 CDP-diacylglycerol-glycerol-3-phosphate 3-phosphatidyltransferase-like [Carpediemonas membranifera]
MVSRDIRFHVPNVLSLSRVPGVFLTTIFLFVPVTVISKPRTIACILYAISALTDYADGLAARKLHATTTFGIVYDAIADKVLVLNLFMAFLTIGVFPPLYLFLVMAILAREFLITGLRIVAAVHDVVLAAEKSGKIKTATMMVATNAILLSLAMAEFPDRFSSETISLVRATGEVCFLISCLLAITSGAVYCKKYHHLLTLEAPNRDELVVTDDE